MLVHHLHCTGSSCASVDDISGVEGCIGLQYCLPLFLLMVMRSECGMCGVEVVTVLRSDQTCKWSLTMDIFFVSENVCNSNLKMGSLSEKIYTDCVF